MAGKKTAPLASGVVLANDLTLADISDTIGGLSFDYRVGAVAEFNFPAVDVDRALSKRGLLREDATLRFEGARFQVAAVERDYRGDDVWLTFTARSQLARRLRNMTGRSVDKNITPQQWITSRVKKAGGTALVEPGAKRRTIVQKRGESVLDVIANLASETEVEWVEFDNRVYVGTPWWAFQGGTGLPIWNVNVTGVAPSLTPLEFAAFSSRSSLDDRGQAAEASLSVLADASGRRLRPWHLVNIGRATSQDNGLWLVDSVGFSDDSPTVDVGLSRPLKSRPKNGSNGTGGQGAGQPIKGSSYSDVARPAGWRGRSVDTILSIYRNNRGGLGGHQIYNGCLWYAQEVAGYAHENGNQPNPESLWAALAPGRKHASREVVPGAVLLYDNSNIGHATVYLGGGRVLSTDMNEQGGFSQGQWSIGPADAAERTFGTLLGWYSP